MSAYLVHSYYHRQLEAGEVQVAIKAGRGLLLIDANGKQRFVDNPAKYPEEKWLHACAEGRVYILWATRWSATNELPELATIEPPAAEELATTPAT